MSGIRLAPVLTFVAWPRLVRTREAGRAAA